MSLAATADTASDINAVTQFLAHKQIDDLQSHPPVDCIIICASAILYQAERLFTILEETPNLTMTIILCGGIGHSTQLLWDAVAKSEKYASLGPSIRGKPEARVLEEIMNNHFSINSFKAGVCKLLIEDKSTNCGANALNSRKLLEASDVPTPKSCIIIQDPTMALRTLSSFEKTYDDLETPPTFLSSPLFIPKVRLDSSTLVYDIADVPSEGLWEFDRFMELLLGEVPRLRDDAEGYGPNGKGFIKHVDIPTEVEKAWTALASVSDRLR